MRDGLLPRMEARPWVNSDKVTYRYHPVGRKPVNLGTDRDVAIRRVLDITGQAPHHGSLLWAWEQYQTSKRFLKLAQVTRTDYAAAWKQIDKKFGIRAVETIKSSEVARYIHIDRADSPRRADIEKAVLSNLFKHAILLGSCEHNPTLVVQPHGSEASTVMPETLALNALLQWLESGTKQRKILAYAAEYASLAGNRQVEFLPLVWPRVDEAAGVIRTTRAKQRGKKQGMIVDLIEIKPAMRVLLGKLRALDREGLYLFPNEDGNQYTAQAFKLMWQRSIKAAIAAKVITAEQRFNFHALRRYYVTMHKGATGELPNMHGDKSVTARVYDATKEERRISL